MSQATATFEGDWHGGPAAWLARRPWSLLAVVALISLLALAVVVDREHGRLRLDVDPSLDPLLVPGLQAAAVDAELRRRFGAEEAVLVLFQAPEVYGADALRRLDALTQALAALPGVAQAQSLTSLALPFTAEGELDLRRLRASEYDDPAIPARLREIVADDPLLRGQLVSADGRSAGIRLSLALQSDRELLESGVADAIVATAHAAQGGEVRVAVTGAPVLRAATSRTVLEQLRWTVPAITLLLAGLLALAFRSWRGVWLPLATIALALLWTLATLSLLGRPLNLITSLVPPLLATMGLAYCAHVLTEFETLLRDPGLRDARRRITVLLREISGPVMLTGFTTGVGLLALLLNELPAVREFALLSALGVFYTVILVLGFVPAMLQLAVRRVPRAPLPAAAAFERGSLRLGGFDMRHRRKILIVAAVVGLAAMLLASRVAVGDRFVGAFKPDAPVRVDYEQVNRALGGVTPLSIMVEAAVPGLLLEPEYLAALDELQRWLVAQPEVGSVVGLVDHLRSLDRALAGQAHGRLPATRALASQLLFFGDDTALSRVVDSDRSATVIALRLRVDDTAAIDALLQRLRPHLEQLPRGLQAQVAGQAALMTESVARVTRGQLQSIALALLVIYAVLSLQFGSPLVGLLASLPTALQTALYFGALGLFGVKLNATTSLVECLVLGLAVDDTIHYLARFNTAARRTASETTAAVNALCAVLRPITLTKAILVVGFLVLVTGELQNQVLFGWLAAFTLAAAWLVDAFVTPAFISGVRVVTLWDSLRLNLGRDVQKRIPLFAGLTARQARIFALMARIETLPAGTLIMRQGDPGGDVYTVIDGKLSVWIERDGERIELNRLKRGGVVGEGGYFGQKRMANVQASTRVRLLRFDDADQERICKRYPAIAARVFLNLNRLQAERRAQPLPAPQP